MMNRKILILANNDIGLFNFRKELLQKLILDNFEVIISLPYGTKVDNLVQMGCVFLETDIDRRGINVIKDFKLFLHYIKIILRINPRIVLTYTIKPNIYGGFASLILNKEYIINITGLGSSVENPGVLRIITLLLYRVALHRAKCVFVQNESNLEFLKTKKIFKGKKVLLPGSGVNLDDFKALEYPNDDIVNFIFISRIMKEKGIDQYLEAAEITRLLYPNVRFHILGFCEENYQKKLNEMQNKGIILYHGMQSDVSKYYKMAHCIIHPSYYSEGMSNVLLEALASARPVITSTQSGCVETVEDGINGYVFHKRNTNNLVEKIVMFMNLSFSEREKMGLAGRMKVEKEFNRNIVISRYLDEIERIIRIDK